MPTYRLKTTTIDMIQFTDGVGIAAVADFCGDIPGDRRFRLTPSSNGGWVAEYLPAPGWTWQPVAAGAWLIRQPDGTVMAAPAALGGALAALFEEVAP